MFFCLVEICDSGMMVQEPSRGQRDVDALFNRVRQSGSAREGPLEPSPAAPSNRGAFSGTARTLAGEPRQQEQAAGATPVTGTPQAPQPVLHIITFWRNGFTVGDGPLRRLDDPANAPFLDVSLLLCLTFYSSFPFFPCCIQFPLGFEHGLADALAEFSDNSFMCVCVCVCNSGCVEHQQG